MWSALNKFVGKLTRGILTQYLLPPPQHASAALAVVTHNE